MKSTLADIKQLFNAKSVTTASKNVDEIEEGEFAIVNSATYKTVVPNNFAALPDKFELFARVGGKLYQSFEPIEKGRIKNLSKKDYVAPVQNQWAGIIENCKCSNSFTLVVNVDASKLIQQDGLTWTHRDIFVELTRPELDCYCSKDTPHLVYENNVITMLLDKKIKANEPDFYKSFVGINTTGVDTGATAPPTGGEETKGDLYIRTGSTAPGTYQYSGSAWVLVGDEEGIIADVEAFVEFYKDVNTDSSAGNEGPKLVLFLEGLPQATEYQEFDSNYLFPRAVRLNPAVIVDDVKGIPFTETQPLVVEKGAGADLRAEEWENMSYYTDLNYFYQLSDGLPNPNIKMQFENGINYNTIVFEYSTKKTGEGVIGEKYKDFGVTIATSDSTAYNTLKTAFGL